MILYTNIPELNEVSTGYHTVLFKDGQSNVTEEIAAHLMGLYPGQFRIDKPGNKKKDD